MKECSGWALWRPQSFKQLRFGFCVILLVALSVATAMGQLAGKGTVTGIVTDVSGAVVPGATVTATNTATNVSMERKTTASGGFSLPLDPGVYNIKVEAKGFKAASRTSVNVNALEAVSADFALAVGSSTEVVEVTAGIEVLDTTTSQVTSTMEQEIYSSLPVPQSGTQRRATDFVQYMPGVNAQPTNGGLDTNTGVVNGSGSRGAVSAVYIEGVPLTSVAGQGDPRFIWTAIPMEAINQFQVTTVGYPATYEGQGVLNYDIKRGTNNIHGSAYDYFRNTALDTWGYMASVPMIDPLTNTARPQQKQAEHQNDYGFSAGAPIIKDKLFVFGAFEGYKLRSAPNLQYQGTPTAKMMAGDFSELSYKIYDPASTTCNASNVCTRTAFANNIIPANRLSSQALYLQKFLPAGDTTGNYLGGQTTGRNNWMNTNRVDYNVSPEHNISGIFAIGRQSTLGGPGTGGGGYTGALTSTTNQAPAPYGSSQDFTVATTVIILEDTYTFNSHVINQFKAAFGRYSSTGTNRSSGNGWGAAAAGITGLPAGQASDSFPTVTFGGNASIAGINRWAGYTSNRNAANGTILTDNVQWEKGKHSLTIGGQLAWMQYNYLNATTGVNPLQLTFNSSETAGYKANSNSVDTATGNAYASFLLGAANNGTFTVSSVPETGARFRAISPYVQDNWKVTSKLTLNLGLRWDFYPPYLEAQDRLSWMDPQKTNTLVNYPGALSFAGNGSNQTGTRTNVNNYYKNLGPRLGFAYQMFPKTVIRGSWGVMYTHGNNVGGSALSRQGSGLAGYSASPRTNVVAPAVGQTGTVLWYLNQPYPSYTNPPILDPTLGTTFTTATTAAAQTANYADPYYGSRAPEYINWSFGIQQQLSASTSMTLTYVGSEGHFTNVDSTTGRGVYANQLDPKWLYLNSKLGNTATAANLTAAGVTAPYPTFVGASGATITQALRPFPQYNGVADILGYIGNTSFHALEAMVQRRTSKGLTFMGNYTWSKSIDNSGTFRSGYDIPAQFAADGQFHAARSLDRSVSLGDIPHRVVGTAVYSLPFGKGDNRLVKALASGWKVSSIFSAQKGAPVGLVYASCPTNPSAATCQPFLNPNFTGDIMKLGGYTHVPATQLKSTSYFDVNAFLTSTATGNSLSIPTYMFSTTARTAPLGLRNSGNYQLDMSLKRSFRINERFKFNFQVDAYNLTNHTRLGFANNGTIVNVPVSSTSAAPTTAFGTVGVMNTSRYFQLSARVDF